MKWVTRERPKIDRIACPWLIAKFIDKQPEFLYVPGDQVLKIAAATGATPYDVPGVKMTHVGNQCSFDAWETEFRKIGAGLGGGSGWVILGFNQHTRQVENYWLADHDHGPAATTSILVMDMYEHAYQMDFGAAAAKYIDAFFQNVQWDAVAARIAALPKP